MMDSNTGDAVSWLLSSAEPAVRLLARRDLLGQDIIHTGEVLDGAVVRTLLRWQWPDGGWNCDPRATGRRSSFHESLAPAWGLFEYWQATGEPDARQAALRTAELFLEHRLFRSLHTGEVIRRDWLTLHYPPYWHYDILQALLVLSRMRLTGDLRCCDALAVLDRRRRPDGRWQPGAYWWKPPGTPRGTVEVIDWGRSAPSEMITLNALRILRTGPASETPSSQTS